MSKNYSIEIVSAIRKFLTDDDWHFRFNDEEGYFAFGLSLHGRLKNIDYIVNVREDEFSVRGISPISADQKDVAMMTKLAEYFTRVNYGLRNGCFQVDYSDGEISYRSYVDCDNSIPSQEVIKNSIYCTARMFDKYAEGMLDIMFAGSDPKEAVDKSENDFEQELLELLNQIKDDIAAQKANGLSNESGNASNSSEEQAKMAVKTSLFDVGGDEE